MLDVTLLSVRVRPLSVAELLIVRFLSRVEGRHDAMVRTLVRLRFLREAIGSALGARAARGMAAAEASLLLLLVCGPATSAADVRRKALLVRTYMEGDPHGNAGAMLTAGLEADARRLGSLVEGDEADDVSGLPH